MKDKGFKIGACDWSIGKNADPGCFAVAKKIGLDGVQVSLGTAANDMHLRKPEMQKKYLAESKKHGVEIASLAIGELNKFPYMRGQFFIFFKSNNTVSIKCYFFHQ